MTEAEWLASNNINVMLASLINPSQRKIRLFACACVRQIWHLLTDDRSRNAVQVAERYADDAATNSERIEAANAAYVAYANAANVAYAATNVAYAAYATAYAAADATTAARAAATAAYADVNGTYVAANATNATNAAVQASLLREIFGNPFRPSIIDPAWWQWDDGCIANMVLSAYKEECWDTLPIIADALEDAGCTSQPLLEHLRTPGCHVKGCWAVDALVGRI